MSRAAQQLDATLRRIQNLPDEVIRKALVVLWQKRRRILAVHTTLRKVGEWLEIEQYPTKATPYVVMAAYGRGIRVDGIPSQLLLWRTSYAEF